MAIMKNSSQSQSTAEIAPISDRDARLLTLTTPVPAYCISTTRPPFHTTPPEDGDEYTDAVDDFFGVTYSREERRARLAQATHASRHDAPVQISKPVSVDEKAVLPSYTAWAQDLERASVAETLPQYGEAVTVKASFEFYSIPQALYKWGFFFPLFWFLGALLLINFHSPTELVPIYTPEESALRIQALRTAERRWAGRCLLAWAIFTFFALATAGVTYGIVMSLKN